MSLHVTNSASNKLATHSEELQVGGMSRASALLEATHQNESAGNMSELQAGTVPLWHRAIAFRARLQPARHNEEVPPSKLWHCQPTMPQTSKTTPQTQLANENPKTPALLNKDVSQRCVPVPQPSVRHNKTCLVPLTLLAPCTAPTRRDK